MARRRGPLLLLAFLAAVMVGGGGGVTAPWMPRPTDVAPETATLAHVQPPLVNGIWGRLRME
ncbi:MAG: hypothetical protein R3C32_07025 [Chloroflexota bacterium]